MSYYQNLNYDGCSYEYANYGNYDNGNHDDTYNEYADSYSDHRDPVRGPPISAHLQVQLWSEHATPVVAMQLQTPCATLITSKNPPPQHQPHYTHLVYLLYSPFSHLSDIYSCHP